MTVKVDIHTASLKLRGALRGWLVFSTHLVPLIAPLCSTGDPVEFRSLVLGRLGYTAHKSVGVLRGSYCNHFSEYVFQNQIPMSSI